jgi:hypothetical protein
MYDFNEALYVVNNCLTYKPGYTISAVDFSERHGGSLLVRLLYTSHDYAQAFAPTYDDHPTIVVPFFLIIVPEHYENRNAFLKALFLKINTLDTHENREAFRYWNGREWEGILNPHLPKGQVLYGDPDGDIAFNDIALNGPELASRFGDEKTR